MKNIFALASCLFLASCTLATHGQSGASATVFEGARLITGDGSAPIEDSAFLVEGNQFTRIGRRGQFALPSGTRHISLNGKTVIPGKVDLHGHIGYQHGFDGTMAKEYFTRESLMDHLTRLAFCGSIAVIGIGDVVDRHGL